MGSSPDEVFAAQWERVRRNPADRAAWISFANMFARTRFNAEADSDQLLDVLLACLAQEDLDPQPLAGTAMRLLGRAAHLAPLLRAAEEARAEELRGAVESADVAAALDRPVVVLALTRLIFPSMAFERVFTETRRWVTAHVAAGGHVAPRAACALARQCFLNGYVWDHGEDEVSAVEKLAASMRDRALDPSDLPAICVLGSYVPLWTWDRAEDVVALATRVSDPWFTGLIWQQIGEPLEELLVAESIPSLGMSGNAVSADVRDQYEEHPYPRWSAVNVQGHETVQSALREALGDVQVEQSAMARAPKVLVAGCGTGRQLAQVALRFPGAQVTGVDLSLSSLAYAVRRCGEMGLERVSVMQGDILALEGWEESFDIVECGGVLHHLEDPREGWRILTTLLRPGGLMRIALYSATARRSVVRAREFIARKGFDATPEGIRAARPVLARHFAGTDPGLLKWLDFYTMQECRDLLFHVQEHRFTLPEIQVLLRALGLDFLGFELTDSATTPAFLERFPQPNARRSLGAWHTFEESHPDTFRGMYQFWVRDATHRSA